MTNEKPRHRAATRATPYRRCPMRVRNPAAVDGRCWHLVGASRHCRSHGDVSRELAHYLATGELSEDPRR